MNLWQPAIGTLISQLVYELVQSSSPRSRLLGAVMIPSQLEFWVEGYLHRNIEFPRDYQIQQA